ncbi:ubiquinol-cytochrome c reductase complex assembly factor 6 sloth 2 [Rhodnius prolixus]|uniref:ubiquinol-cytochrome c reductase complex assembly factor 6 sloth 2 n=1 Tax=Rhodnius prolixus TaxID=13249 RepID=UPI003D18CC53
MPAGVSWPQYLKVVTAALISMFAGAQIVHNVYRPLDDLDELVQKEIDKRLQSQTKNEV